MPISVAELELLTKEFETAHFVDTNLHLHTPATAWDWDDREDQTRRARDITIDQYFEALCNTSLELVAITDHNSVSWCKPLISLAKSARATGKCNIWILPGVEITTYEGPHLVAIFDELTEVEEIQQMLVRLGMSGNGEEKDRVGIKSDQEKTISEVLGEVDRLKGIVIAPHVDSKDGLWGHREFRGRNAALNDPRLRILAATSGDIKIVKEGANKRRLLYKNMDTSLINNSFGFINVSDCHRLEDFEKNTTWIKMTTPSLEGIRQIIFEPELRVAHSVSKKEADIEHPEIFSFSQPSTLSHPHILAVVVEGVMLNGLKAVFSPYLNCVIGKNYSGKSALLDCVRFVLDKTPSEVDAHSKLAERLQVFVGEGGLVKAYLNDGAGKVYGISRVFSTSRTPRTSKLTIEGKPDVFLRWGDEFRLESDLSIDKVFSIEAYPQGEVVKIKDNISQQMKIVDALAGNEPALQDLISETSNGEITLLGKLATNRLSIVVETQKCEKFIEETSGIQGLRDEIAQLEALSTSPAYTEKKNWAEIGVKLDLYIKGLQVALNGWSSESLLLKLVKETSEADLSITISKPTEIDLNTSVAEVYSKYALTICEWVSKLIKHSVEQDKETLKEALQLLKDLENSRKKREDQAYAEILKNAKAEDVASKGDVLIGRITEKTKCLNGLTAKEGELESAKHVLATLIKERSELLLEFESRWSSIHRERATVVKMIQDQCGNAIKADLLENEEIDDYRTLLEKIAEGLTGTENRIQRKENQLNEIAANTNPKQLAEIVGRGDANDLVRICPSVTINTARILLGMSQNAQMHLEECRLGDRFALSYRKVGDSAYTRVDSGLSGGEQALALISIAMVPKKLPLMIDQPEDELGPALITYELVEQIRRVKQSRQLIFVTHVANIPVLADSEQVLTIEQIIQGSNKTSCLKCCGSLDKPEIIETLLELDGGVIAFAKRSQRYSSILKDAS